MCEQVICADLTSWDAFVALGAALTQRGARVLRLTGDGGSRQQRLRVALERLAFSETRPTLRQDHGRSMDLTPILGALPTALDVQATDRIAAALAATPEWLARRDLNRVHAPGLDDSMLYDKLACSQFAQESGIRIPETWASIDQVPVGVSVAVKARLGSGGDAVALLPGGTGLDEAWGRLGSPSEVFAQRLLPGELWNVGGVAMDGEMLEASAYRAWPAAKNPDGPSVLAEPHDRPDLLASTQRLLSALSYRGPFCIDFVSDEAGTPCLIDFNPRFFGAWTALQASGVDIIGSYLHVVLGAPRPVPTRRITRKAFPTGPAAVSGNPLSLVLDTRKMVGTLGGDLGPRWRTIAGIEALAGVRGGGSAAADS